GFDANELLSQMAENVPKSLETIEIRMDYDNPWIFSADSLRKFFEGWCKGRGGNKKFRVLRLEPMEQQMEQTSRLLSFISKMMGNEHFDVIEEYRIQFDLNIKRILALRFHDVTNIFAVTKYEKPIYTLELKYRVNDKYLCWSIMISNWINNDKKELLMQEDSIIICIIYGDNKNDKESGNKYLHPQTW
ncbi:617_t:CDS:2, partial [Diversispora eburnea]